MKRIALCILFSLCGFLAYSQAGNTNDHLSDLLSSARVHYINSKYIDAAETVTELLSYDLRARTDLKNQAVNLLIDICHATGQHIDAIELCKTLLKTDILEKQEETEIIRKLIYSCEQIGDIENTIAWNEKLLGLTGVTIEYLDNEAVRYMLAMDFTSEVYFRLKSLHLRRAEFGDDSPEYAIGLLFRQIL